MVARLQKVLCVAEKPMVCREVTKCLNGGALPPCNNFGRVPNYSFSYRLDSGETWEIVFTAVRGHVMEHAFPAQCKSWSGFPTKQLFDTPIEKRVNQDNEDVANNLKHQTRGKDLLVLWLDCDREGEAIGFEVIDICKSVKRTIAVKRARFSALVPSEIKKAINRTVPPNQKEADAVEARSILDLRSGAAFTRFQTLLLQDRFDWQQHGVFQTDKAGNVRDKLLNLWRSESYLVVALCRERKAHVPESFWNIVMKHGQNGKLTTFFWARGRLFDHHIAAILYQMCLEESLATITKVDGRMTTRNAPAPLSTLELQKKCTGILRMSGDQVMAAAESLYQKGLVSYPRTETDEFDQAQDVQGLCRMLADGDAQAGGGGWGWAAHAQQVAYPPNNMWRWPRSGGNNDHAHPPIHPTQFVAPDALAGPEKSVYEFICRSFLASCSKDAIGFQTTMEARIAQEDFSTTGLMVMERNWLLVYRYTSWDGAQLPPLQPGDTFVPAELLLHGGQTQPPSKLSERDLLSLMDRFGIGTDATVAEHIARQQERGYAVKDDSQLFEPTPLGEALIGAYDNMGLKTVYECVPLGIESVKGWPHQCNDSFTLITSAETRGEFEKQLKRIVQGTKTLDSVLTEDGERYKVAFEAAAGQSQKIMQAMALFFQPRGAAAGAAEMQLLGMCGCGGMIQLARDAELEPVRAEITCSSSVVQGCTVGLGPMPITATFREFEILQENCPTCEQQGRQLKRVRMRFNLARLHQEALGIFDDPNLTSCLVCDPRMKTLFQRLQQRAPRRYRAGARGGRGGRMPAVARGGGQHGGAAAGRNGMVQGAGGRRGRGPGGRNLGAAGRAGGREVGRNAARGRGGGGRRGGGAVGRARGRG